MKHVLRLIISLLVVLTISDYAPAASILAQDTPAPTISPDRIRIENETQTSVKRISYSYRVNWCAGTRACLQTL
jgi:uncharacterized protein YxeA